MKGVGEGDFSTAVVKANILTERKILENSYTICIEKILNYFLFKSSSLSTENI